MNWKFWKEKNQEKEEKEEKEVVEVLKKKTAFISLTEGNNTKEDVIKAMELYNNRNKSSKDKIEMWDFIYEKLPDIKTWETCAITELRDGLCFTNYKV